KDAAARVDASDVTKTPPAPAGAAPAGGAQGAKGLHDKAKQKLRLAKETAAPGEPAGDDGSAGDLADLPAPGANNVSVAVHDVTLLPGALASGNVTFGDGATAKWVVDQYGRPGFTEVSKPGYRPTPGDAQAFMQELSVALQSRGF